MFEFSGRRYSLLFLLVTYSCWPIPSCVLWFWSVGSHSLGFICGTSVRSGYNVSLQKIYVLASARLLGTTSLDHFNFSSWKLNPRSGQTVGMKSQRIVLSPPLSSLFCFLFCGWIIFSSSYFTERIVLRGSWSASSQLPNMGTGFFLLSTNLDLIILFSYLSYFSLMHTTTTCE